MRNAIVIASDHALLPVATWLWRLLTEMNPRADTDVILISERRHDRLWGMPVPSGMSISADSLSMPVLDYPTTRRIPKASYWRLGAPASLGSAYRRLLYLDVDVLPATQALFECFDYELGGAAIAACQSPHHFKPTRRNDGRVLDGGFSFDRYFNSGVMLIDTSEFAKHRIAEKAFDIIARQGENLKMHDQTALNLALDGKWAELSMSYNFWAGALGTFLETVRPPKVIHYHGNYKPWHLVTPYPSSPLRLALLGNLLTRGAGHLLFRGLHPRAALHRRMRMSTARFINTENAELMHYLEQPTIGSAGA